MLEDNKMEEFMIDKDKPESEEILEIKQGRCYVRIPRRKKDIELIKKIFEVFEEFEEPVVEPVKVPVKPKQPVPGVKKPGVKVHKKITRAKFRYPDGLRNFCINNIDKIKNPELVIAVNEEFDLDMDYTRLMSFLKYNNIKRSEGISKSQTGKGEKQLKTLPPEDNY